MGFAAGLMMLAGTAVSAVSAYRQGQYASMQAKAQAKISDYNAMVADTNAEAIRQKSIFDQVRAVTLGRGQIGEALSELAEAKAVISEGAPADILAEQAYENALDVALIGYEGMVGAARQKSAASMYRNEAANYLTSAKNYAQAGKTAAWATGLSGLGKYYLLTGFGGGGGGDYLGASGAPVNYNELSPYQQKLFRSMV